MINDYIEVFKTYFYDLAVQVIVAFSKDCQLITWTGNKDYDKSTNSLKSRCFQVITKIMKYYRKIEKNKIKQSLKEGTQEDGDFVKLSTNLTLECFKNLEKVITERFSYIQNFGDDNPDYNYESILFYILEYLYTVSKQQSFVQYFNTQSLRL